MDIKIRIEDSLTACPLSGMIAVGFPGAFRAPDKCFLLCSWPLIKAENSWLSRKQFKRRIVYSDWVWGDIAYLSWGKAWRQQREATGHRRSSRQRWVLLVFVFQSSPRLNQWHCLHLGWALPPQLHLSGDTPTDTELILNLAMPTMKFTYYSNTVTTVTKHQETGCF